eukprot:CAMPEP_0171986304 /NCGR_PEP_ID=MMETSP0993-20121228/274804_1 /TAXON_ID=483369 /ORGANISM="non described non described, Strain CCMP2098" /LENGTH=580 /DNA_ID=CAMNT_0012639209 /DNA_START=8 /DNA_END=1750 /DNA_ORIENTATION=+
MSWKGQYVIVTTLAAAVTLHLLSDASLSSSGDGTWAGIFGISAPAGDTMEVAGLVAQRSLLVSEIEQLRHVVSQLEKMDLTTDLRDGSVSAFSSSNALLSQLAPAVAYVSTNPSVPSSSLPLAPPPHLRVSGSNSFEHTPRSSSGTAVDNLKVVTPSFVDPTKPLREKESSTAAISVVTPTNHGSSGSHSSSTSTSRTTSTIASSGGGSGNGGGGGSGNGDSGDSGPAVLFEGDPLPSSFRDFPCALRNFKKAQVTTTCEIDCGDGKCSKAFETCAGYVECHALVFKGAADRSNPNLSGASAVLKTDSSRSRDNSLERVRLSAWWGTPALSTQPRPRVYIVASYGGCGSKMMAGWLSQLAPQHKTYVFHLHDRTPPQQLHTMAKPPSPVIKGGGRGEKSDYRSGRFPGASVFKEDTGLVPPNKLDDYRVVFLYKDPVESLVSRYGFGHCLHIQGDCGEAQGMTEKTWPKLDAYAKAQKDDMRLSEHFNNYMQGGGEKRSYPIVALNYHKLWDNLPAMMAALGLPPELEKSFPKRTETVRNDATGKAEGNQAHTEATRELLRKLYRPMIDSVSTNPAVLIV